ncbi:MAG: hypothetical protein NC084_07445 [Bacteroides sp.]|nr:hypothetical protein [Eubacterium sp.]MCM1418513.1 hypothetical protein [Roseburia sp.]MCM1462533.1 hypothetical protein [Bacteroides sp.]
MQEQKDRPTVPLGLGYALAENSDALKHFAELSELRRREVIEQSRAVASKAEMRAFVERLGNEHGGF